MHLDALDPADIIKTFTDTDEIVPGVVVKTTFVSFGPIQRTYLGRGVTALTVKLRSFTGPGGTREVFEVTHSPIANFDLHALANAVERARRFVGDARCIDFSTMYHSDWEAVAREVAVKSEPLAMLETYVAEVAALAGASLDSCTMCTADEPCAFAKIAAASVRHVGVDFANGPDRTVFTTVEVKPDGSREVMLALGFAAEQARVARDYVEIDALENAYWIDGALATCSESSPCA